MAGCKRVPQFWRHTDIPASFCTIPWLHLKSVHLPFLSQSPKRVGSGAPPPLVGPPHSKVAGSIMGTMSSSSSSSTPIGPHFSSAAAVLAGFLTSLRGSTPMGPENSSRQEAVACRLRRGAPSDRGKSVRCRGNLIFEPAVGAQRLLLKPATEGSVLKRASDILMSAVMPRAWKRGSAFSLRIRVLAGRRRSVLAYFPLTASAQAVIHTNLHISINSLHIFPQPTTLCQLLLAVVAHVTVPPQDG